MPDHAANRAVDDVRSDIVAKLRDHDIGVCPDQPFEAWLVALGPDLVAELTATFSMYTITRQVWVAMVSAVTGRSMVSVSHRARRTALLPWSKQRTHHTVVAKLQAAKAFNAWHVDQHALAG
jgi:hypothetical protein